MCTICITKRLKVQWANCQDSYLHSPVCTVRSGVVPTDRSLRTCICGRGDREEDLLPRSRAKSCHRLRHSGGRALDSTETIAKIIYLIYK